MLRVRTSRPRTEETASSFKLRARAKAKERQRVPRLTRTLQPSFDGECRHCGKKGHKWADCRKRLAEAKDEKFHAVVGALSSTVAAVEDTEVIDEASIRGDCSDEEDNRD